MELAHRFDPANPTPVTDLWWIDEDFTIDLPPNGVQGVEPFSYDVFCAGKTLSQISMLVSHPSSVLVTFQLNGKSVFTGPHIELKTVSPLTYRWIFELCSRTCRCRDLMIGPALPDVRSAWTRLTRAQSSGASVSAFTITRKLFLINWHRKSHVPMSDWRTRSVVSPLCPYVAGYICLLGAILKTWNCNISLQTMPYHCSTRHDMANYAK